MPEQEGKSASTNGDVAAETAQIEVAPYATRKVDHELDQKGDTILVLRPSSAPLAVWMHDNEWPNALDQSSTATETEDQESATADGDAQDSNNQPPTIQAEGKCEDQEPSEVLFRVSSRHLILASDYFQKLFEGPWSESGTPTSDSPRILTIEDWREEAMLTLMNIIHGRFRKVPKKVTLEFAAEVCVLVDYYQCHEVMEMHSQQWISHLPDPPFSYSREPVLDMLVSIVFRREEILGFLCQHVIELCRGPMQTLGLPIPSSLVDALDNMRQDCIHHLLEHTYSQFKCFINEGPICDVKNCDDALLGCFTKMLLSGGLLFSQPKKPYYGYSWTEVAYHLEGASSPNTHHSSTFQCSVGELLQKKVNQLQESIDTFGVPVPLTGGCIDE